MRDASATSGKYHIFFLDQQITKNNSACLGGCGLKSMEVTEQVARLPARKFQEISFDLTTDPSP